MTKRKKCLDNIQQSFLDFDSTIEVYQTIREELLKIAHPPLTPPSPHLYEEYCNEIAVAVNKAIRESGLSREIVVDRVNEFFGWPADGDGRQRLTINMLNNYLCRPSEYNMPIPYLHAIQRITESLHPLRAQADMEGVRIITKEEENELALGKIEAAMMDFQKAKRELRGRVRR